MASCTKEFPNGPEPTTPEPEQHTVRLQLPSSLVVMPASRAVATQEENAVTRLDIYVFDENGVLENIMTNAAVSDENYINIKTSGGTVKSFYLIANPQGVSALGSVHTGQTTAAQFRELATDIATQPVSIPLMMTGYVEDADISNSKTININVKRRITRLDFGNEPLLTGFTVSRVLLSNVTPSVHVFGNATQPLTTTKEPVVFDYHSDQTTYFLLLSGEADVTLEGVRAGETHTSLMGFSSMELKPNVRYSLRVPDYGAYMGNKQVVFTAGQSETDYRTGIPTSWSASDYSGITWIEGNRYAVVHDKMDGFYIMELNVTASGITPVSRSSFYGNTGVSRDCEGIVYHPGRGTVFISGEADQQILEYDMAGNKTGAKLAVPAIFAKSNGTGNYGFEALAYDRTTGRFWTTTEATLPADGGAASPSTTRKHNVHRLQAFDENLQPVAQYAYKSDNLSADGSTSQYAFGIPEMVALPDGRLLVMEREFAVFSGVISAWDSRVDIKVFLVDPRGASDVSGLATISGLSDSDYLPKQQLASFRTPLSSIANYEGMCLGPVLSDGTRSLLLINDSQSRYSAVLGLVKLDEYLKMMKLKYQ